MTYLHVLPSYEIPSLSQLQSLVMGILIAEISRFWWRIHNLFVEAISWRHEAIWRGRWAEPSRCGASHAGCDAGNMDRHRSGWGCCTALTTRGACTACAQSDYSRGRL